ncbi:MAG: formate/nitrite transporter family protein [Pseudomonadota bacterium]
MTAAHKPEDWNAYRPADMAKLVEQSGVTKAHLELVPLLALAVLAGAFISLGGGVYITALNGIETITGLHRLAAGMAFSLGLILVIVGGAELFTGNALMVMALVDRRIPARLLLRNWIIVFAGNTLGAFAVAALFWLGGLIQGDFAVLAQTITEAKLSLSALSAFARGILCNALVCLAVWLTFSARTAAGKVLLIVPPIAAFVAMGFEHSIANLFFLPLGIIAGADWSLGAVAMNILPVTAGNIIGGAGGVALAYWVAFDRKPETG